MASVAYSYYSIVSTVIYKILRYAGSCNAVLTD
jgi:hypothetical protein